MAAIDPSAEAELEDPEDKRPARATLKLVRVPDGMLDDDDSDDEDFDLEAEEDDEDSDEEEEANGGPSEKKSKAVVKAEDNDEDMEDEDEEEDEDDEDEAEALAQLAKIMKSAKGKAKALDGEEDADDEDDSDDEALEMDEVVICTLDPEKVCHPVLNSSLHAHIICRTINKLLTSWLVKVKKSFSRFLVPTLST